MAVDVKVATFSAGAGRFSDFVCITIKIAEGNKEPLLLLNVPGGLSPLAVLLEMAPRFKDFQINVSGGGLSPNVFSTEVPVSSSDGSLVQFINEQINNYRLYKKMRILLPSTYKSAQILCPVWILMILSSLILGWALISEFPLFDLYIFEILFVFVGVLVLTFKLFISFIKDIYAQWQLRALQSPRHIK